VKKYGNRVWNGNQPSGHAYLAQKSLFHARATHLRHARSAVYVRRIWNEQKGFSHGASYDHAMDKAIRQAEAWRLREHVEHRAGEHPPDTASHARRHSIRSLSARTISQLRLPHETSSFFFMFATVSMAIRASETIAVVCFLQLLVQEAGCQR
jgi:hypothetical protein